jgi:hypothetical protein
MRNITISPISSNEKSNSHIDYQEQLLRTESLLDGDAFWCWDDSKYNKAKEDELFAFFFPKSKKCEGKVIIHKINQVKDPANRLESWSKNVGQGNRNVLELSSIKIEYTMEEWELFGGPMCKQCTYTTDLCKYTTLEKVMRFI